ncbi:unnamed protein product [Brugia pahangi]|uniref:GPI mannosyltransferase 1 n=1 Tax=Brugia pahangi TaxID=6280 RepID=A0A0N4TN88_BRUPA|nr:unnamed protein product [Brugia pahangi]
MDNYRMMIVSAHISIVRAYTLLRSNIIPKRQLMPYSADEWSFSYTKEIFQCITAHEFLSSKNDGISDFFVDERNDHFPHERFRRRSAKSFLVPVITFWILYTVVFTYSAVQSTEAVIIALDLSATQSIAAIKKHLLWDES